MSVVGKRIIYYISLREFQGIRIKGQGPSIRVGDVVILKDDSVKRIFWKLVKVVELLHGNDGVARVALVNVANGNGPPKVSKRNVRHLILIEVNDTDECKDRPTPKVDTTAINDGPRSEATEDTTTSSTRPRRQVRLLEELGLDIDYCVCSPCDQIGGVC